jgi:hypothetical protein
MEKKFECPACGTQYARQIKTCKCGRKGHLGLIGSIRTSGLPDFFPLDSLKENKRIGKLLEIDAMPNFVEKDTVEQANLVDLDIYRLLNYSDRRSVYVFQKRSNLKVE